MTERAYWAPPAIVSAQLDRTGGALILGSARPGSTVLLATPQGAAERAKVGSDGRWRLVLPPSPDVRLFGLSMLAGGRRLQAEGYIALLPGARAALLRAGAGARVIEVHAPRGPTILAVDFDQGAGVSPVAAMISGLANPNSQVAILADERPLAMARASAAGRFSIPVTLIGGVHSFEAVEGPRRDAVDLAFDSDGPLAGAVFRARREGGAWRIDWLTPGGGEQSTVIFAPGAKG
ncbi:MAG: hypothetical protein ACRED9_09470 [Caulobacteraceae bacterium]